jgi:hypothetical protein
MYMCIKIDLNMYVWSACVYVHVTILVLYILVYLNTELEVLQWEPNL